VNGNARSGVILITVLWSVALLATLALAASVSFRGFAGIMAVGRDRLEAEGLFTAGLEAAAGIAASFGEAPLTEVESTLTLAQGSVHLRLEDEGGRIDIGKAPPELLASLLRTVGADDADALARAIVEWRKADPGAAQGPAPPAAGSPAAAPPAPAATPAADSIITDLGDLLGMPRMRPQWVAAMAPLVTVYGNETVNPLTAPEAVLAALPGMDHLQLSAFLDQRRFGVDPKQLVASLGAAQKYLDAKPAPAISVHLSATLTDRYSAAADAVIVRLPKDRQPYRVLAWTPARPLPPP
jgi:general secretion pathway protein K